MDDGIKDLKLKKARFKGETSAALAKMKRRLRIGELMALEDIDGALYCTIETGED